MCRDPRHCVILSENRSTKFRARWRCGGWARDGISKECSAKRLFGRESSNPIGIIATSASSIDPDFRRDKSRPASRLPWASPATSASRTGCRSGQGNRSRRYAVRPIRQHQPDGSPFIVGEFIAHDSKLPALNLNHVFQGQADSDRQAYTGWNGRSD